MTRLLVLSPGDVCEQFLLFPTLAALASATDRIDVIVPTTVKDAYALCPSVDQIIPFNFSASKGLADWSNLYGKAREPEYDAAIATRDFLSIRFLLWLLGIPSRVGITGGTGEFLLSHAIPKLDHLPKTQAYADLVKVIAPQATVDHPLNIHVTPDCVEWGRSTYEKLGLGEGSSTILLYDQSESGSQPYTLENWRSVVAGIGDRHPDLAIGLLSDAQSESWAKGLKGQTENTQIVPCTKLGQAAALIQLAKAIISTHHAPLYLGVGSNSATLGLFGSEKPSLYLPEGDRIIGLRANSGQVNDISPIQIIESVSQICR